jgi:prepilin-type N-terminal cleavage/methylation domain-containing protein
MRKLVRTVRNAFRYGEAGFTLIELLVVIGILAALAGVTVLAVTQFMGRGKCEACRTEVHQCQTAVAAWMVDNTGTPLTPCSAYLGSTLLTPLKYGSAWAVSATGVVTPGTTCTSLPNCATP